MHGFLVANHKLAEYLAHQLHTLEESTKQLEIARQHAASSNEAKSRFLAHASHDLRQPLHAIGLLNSNLQHEKMNRFARETVKKIDQSVANMSALFRSLLDYSALDLGHVQPQIDHFNLENLLQGVANRNLETAQQAKCQIQIQTSSGWVETDHTLLTNIVQNLVSNAIKYAPGKPITIGSLVQGQTITIFVEDQGKGIAKEKIHDVFKEFYREHKPGTQKIEGLGLGLALVKSYSQILSLTCTMTSERDRGTKVEISGIKTAPEQTHSARKPVSSHLRLSGLKVHVVDNNIDILSATVKLLNSWGCIATSSKNIPDAKLGIDLLITDFDLDDQHTGVHCIKRMRKIEGRRIPALVITGVQNLDRRELNIEAPFGMIEKTCFGATNAFSDFVVIDQRKGTFGHLFITLFFYKPASRPTAAAADRVSKCKVLSIAETWVRTVKGEISRSRAISLLVLPATTNLRTSRCREDSLAMADWEPLLVSLVASCGPIMIISPAKTLATASPILTGSIALLIKPSMLSNNISLMVRVSSCMEMITMAAVG
ncbi:MAG: hybrid sensor histidine kinase/response regulator [Robiginitomaculum sp.]|nr:hybrid sensor histidine kinase/response regulator [Robiginitomaculum sp.]